jgi:exodeoxyribonuclease V alpha subunit
MTKSVTKQQQRTGMNDGHRGDPDYATLQRNLLYTGITRGKRLVVLVGQKKAVAIAVRNVSGRRRWSKLEEWLQPLVYAVLSS